MRDILFLIISSLNNVFGTLIATHTEKLNLLNTVVLISFSLSI